ncbi:MAG: penicillin-binding transpeptidase domain-containing protein, partial [Patescibacteria group bacterium]
MKKRHIQIEDILSDKGVEENLREVPIPRASFFGLIVVASIVIAVATAQLLNLNILKGGFYTERALDNVSDTKVKVAPRGVIEDRFGKPIVENAPSFNIFLYPRLLPQDVTARDTALRKVSVIMNVNFDGLFQKLEERDWSLSDRILLTSDVSQDALVALSAKDGLGIRIEEGFKRTTPYAFSQVAGYTGLVGRDDLDANKALALDDQIGRSGLEAYYDTFLRGENGKDVTFKSAGGEVKDERVEKESKAGKNVRTYIDSEFQTYFYNRLADQLKSIGRDIGLGIAIDPRNGEILALVNVPGFDINNVGQALVDARKPLFNRVISGVYSPGSTIKPLVAIAALTEKLIDPKKQILSIGYIELPNPYNPDKPSRFLDWKPHGWVDMYSALARSSDVYFYAVGGGFKDQKGLGIYKLKEWWDMFGLAQKTNIDLPGEKVGFLPDPEWKQKKTGQPWRIGDTYNVSIGQGDFMITPIELINYIAAIANGGTFYKPRVVESISDTKGNEVLRTYPSTLADIREKIKDAIPDVQQGMRDAVRKSYGTANLLSTLPVEVAGKTGTAQIENNTKTNAFFVGYEPYVNPQIAVLVLIENSKEGDSNTIPVARDVMLWYYNNRLKEGIKN